MRSDYQDTWAWACSLLRVFSLLMGVIGVHGLSHADLLGANPSGNTFEIFRETPPEVGEGEVAPFLFSFPRTNEANSTGTFQVTCEIPAGLVWETWNLRRGNERIDPIEWVYDSLNRSIIAVYATYDEPLFAGTELSLTLRGDCSEKGVNSGVRALVLDICEVPGAMTNMTARVRQQCLIKNQQFPVTLQCQERTCPDGGMNFYRFDLERINQGRMDSNQDGVPDQGPNLNKVEFRTQRLMYGDTLRGLFSGIVAEIDSPLFWQYGFASSRIKHGENLEPIGAKLTIYDASSRRYLRCNDIKISSYQEPPNRMFFFDLTPEKIAEEQASFIGYQFEGRDSVWLETLYRVNRNLGDSVLRAEVDNRFYLSDVENPTLRAQVHQCGSHNAAFTLLGFEFLLGEARRIQVSYPYEELIQPYQFVLGGADIFSGQDPFPFEYRYLGHIKRAQVFLPPYYEINSLLLEQEGEQYQVIAKEHEPEEEPDTTWVCSGDTVELNLEESLLASRGNGIQKDGAFQGQISLKLIPQCEVSSMSQEEIKWAFTYAHSGWLNGGGESRWYYKEPDRLSYELPKLTVNHYDPACDSTSDVLTWTLTIHNPSSNPVATHSWMNVFLPDSGLEVLHLVDLTTGDTLQSFEDLYRLGTLPSDQTFLYEISVKYSQEPPEFVTIYSGFGCNGYPMEFQPHRGKFAAIDLFPELPKLIQKQEEKVEPEEKLLDFSLNKVLKF